MHRGFLLTQQTKRSSTGNSDLKAKPTNTATASPSLETSSPGPAYVAPKPKVEILTGSTQPHNTSTSHLGSRVASTSSSIVPTTDHSSTQYTPANTAFLIKGEAIHVRAKDETYIATTGGALTCVAILIHKADKKEAVLAHLQIYQYGKTENLMANLFDLFNTIAPDQDYTQCSVHIASEGSPFDSKLPQSILEITANVLKDLLPRDIKIVQHKTSCIAINTRTGIIDDSSIPYSLGETLRPNIKEEHQKLDDEVDRLVAAHGSSFLYSSSFKDLVWLNKTQSQPTLTAQNAFVLLPNEAIVLAATAGEKRFIYASIPDGHFAITIQNTRTKKFCVVLIDPKLFGNNLDAILFDTLNKVAQPEQYKDCTLRFFTNDTNASQVLVRTAEYFTRMTKVTDGKTYFEIGAIQCDAKAGKMATSQKPYKPDTLKNIRADYPSTTPAASTSVRPLLTWITVPQLSLQIETVTVNNTIVVLPGQAAYFHPTDSKPMGYTFGCASCIGIAICNLITGASALGHFQFSQISESGDFSDKSLLMINFKALLEKVTNSPEEYSHCLVRLVSHSSLNPTTPTHVTQQFEHHIYDVATTLENNFPGIKPIVYKGDPENPDQSCILLDSRTGRAYVKLIPQLIGHPDTSASYRKNQSQSATFATQLEWTTSPTHTKTSITQVTEPNATEATLASTTAPIATSTTPAVVTPLTTASLSSQNTFVLHSHEGVAYTASDEKQFVYTHILPDHIGCTVYNAQTQTGLVVQINLTRLSDDTHLFLKSILAEVAIPDQYSACIVRLLYPNNLAHIQQATVSSFDVCLQKKIGITNCKIVKGPQAIQFDVKTGRVFNVTSPLPTERLQAIRSENSAVETPTKGAIIKWLQLTHPTITEQNTRCVSMGKALAFSGNNLVHMAFTQGCGPCVGCIIYDPETRKTVLVHLLSTQMSDAYLSSNLADLFSKISSDKTKYPHYKVYLFSFNHFDNLINISKKLEFNYPGLIPTIYHSDNLFIDARSGKIYLDKLDRVMIKLTTESVLKMAKILAETHNNIIWKT